MHHWARLYWKKILENLNLFTSHHQLNYSDPKGKTSVNVMCSRIIRSTHNLISVFNENKKTLFFKYFSPFSFLASRFSSSLNKRKKFFQSLMQETQSFRFLRFFQQQKNWLCAFRMQNLAASNANTEWDKVKKESRCTFEQKWKGCKMTI